MFHSIDYIKYSYCLRRCVHEYEYVKLFYWQFFTFLFISLTFEHILPKTLIRSHVHVWFAVWYLLPICRGFFLSTMSIKILFCSFFFVIPNNTHLGWFMCKSLFFHFFGQLFHRSQIAKMQLLKQRSKKKLC